MAYGRAVRISLTDDLLQVRRQAIRGCKNDEALMNAGRSLPSGRVGQIVTILQAAEDDAPGVAPPE